MFILSPHGVHGDYEIPIHGGDHESVVEYLRSVGIDIEDNPDVRHDETSIGPGVTVHKLAVKRGSPTEQKLRELLDASRRKELN